MTLSRPLPWRSVLLLLVLTLIAYLPATRAGFIWDDPDYVVNNGTLRSTAGLVGIWFHPTSIPQYYPLVHTTYWIEYHLWGTDAAGYHIDNILLHAAASILLWRVLVKLRVPGALLAAGLFAVHPVQVESVAWITERKNVLSGVFYFASALAYLKFDEDARSRRAYAIALLLFVCALLSKTVTCSLPAALLLVIWWKRGRVNWRDVLPLIPFFVIGIGMAIFTAILERNHVGASGKEWEYSAIDRILIASRAVWFYLAKLIVPVRLSFIYSKWTIDSHLWWQWIFPTALGGLLAALFALRHRIGRGPLVAVLLFIGTLVPALGFINVYPMRYSFVADHFQYHAAVGIFVLIAVMLTRVAHDDRLAMVVLAPLVLLSVIRSAIFHDELTLWTDTLAKNPTSWMVHINLAKALIAADREGEAEPHFQRALELAPDLPETHWNVGINLASRGDFDGAMQHYNRAIQLDPKFAGAYYSRGNVYRQQGRLNDARREYELAIQRFPMYPQAHLNLGIVLEQLGDHAAALAHFEQAVRGNPQNPRAHNSLGKALSRQRRLGEAAFHYEQAIQLDPKFAEAHLNYGALLAAAGQTAAARAQIDEAVRLDPSLAKYVRQILGPSTIR